ncbi:MAG TPA: RNA methyltransferase, partial [Thermodesulfovibrionales bacterium]|nr:RNA methyltransferase [Thermodesulfovibrionales bacterium]
MRFNRITSVANRHVKDAVQIREKRSRFRHDAFVIEGPHLLEAALNSGTGFLGVFVAESFANKKEHQGILRRIAGTTEHIYEVTEPVLSRITDTETPQGIAAVVSYRMRELRELVLQEPPFIVVIDRVQDPGNVGTIIRTADAAGADAVVLLPGTCDAFMPKTIRSTAGSIFHVPIIVSEEDRLLEWLRGKHITLAVTAGDAEKVIYDADLSGPLAMVFGNEAHGVSSRLRTSAGTALRIPIFGK